MLPLLISQLKRFFLHLIVVCVEGRIAKNVLFWFCWGVSACPGVVWQVWREFSGRGWTAENNKGLNYFNQKMGVLLFPHPSPPYPFFMHPTILSPSLPLLPILLFLSPSFPLATSFPMHPISPYPSIPLPFFVHFFPFLAPFPSPNGFNM